MTADLYHDFIRLKTSISIKTESDNGSLIFSNGSDSVSVKVAPGSVEEATRLLTEGCQGEEFFKVCGYEPGLFLLVQCKEKNFLTSAPLNNDKDRFHHVINYYSEFSDYPSEVLELLGSKHVCIVGLGGIGSILARHLLTAGVTSFDLIDPDTIQETNLNRQLFWYEELGKYKVDLLSRRFSVYPHVKCRPFRVFVESAEMLNSIYDTKKPDIIVNCADQPGYQINRIISRWCLANEVDCCFVGAHVHHGHWGPLLTGAPQKERYLEFVKQLENSEKQRGLPSSMSYTNDIIASFLARDIIYHLGQIQIPLSFNKIVSYNFIKNKLSDILSLN